MQNKTKNSIVTGDDGLAYQWLDENTALIGNLKPDQDPEGYSQTLQKIVLEGKKLLGKNYPDDPALEYFLSLLVAEAQVDLALIEKDAARQKTLVTDVLENCLKMVEGLEKQGISGFACNILPRIITILSGAYQAAGDHQRPVIEERVKKVADLLDEFRIQQTMQRLKATEKILEGKVFALSTDGMSNPADRRLVLEKAASSLTDAAGLSGQAFDEKLAGEAGECLAAVERSLGLPDLPAPVFPGSAEPAQSLPQPVVCPHCGNSIKQTSKFCPTCGKPVAAYEGISIPEQSTPAVNLAGVCPTCGGKVRPGARFCPSCGRNLV
ncbi:MAG: zinc ribbon domain-containing protein [Anaerolineaceae bacterium]